MESSLFDSQPLNSLNLDLLKDIDLTKYPPSRLHFLIHALQKGYKPPSESSMRRAEIRNQRKSGAFNANKVIGRHRLRQNFLASLPRINHFYLHQKFGVKPPLIDLSQKRGKKFSRPKPIRIRRPAHVIPKKSISLPSQIKPKTRGKRIPKKTIDAFRNHAPAWILEKAARDKFRREVQEYYKLKGINFDNKILQKKNTPLYFQKKKANQHRRRRQKHLLIQSNRKALTEIFGDAIFKKGWPVSRKQIKLALGINQQNHMKPQFIGEFMEMAQRRRQILILDQFNNAIKTNKLAAKSDQVSRMARKSNIKKVNQADKSGQGFLLNSGGSPQEAISYKLERKSIVYRPPQNQFPSIFDVAKKSKK